MKENQMKFRGDRKKRNYNGMEENRTAKSQTFEMNKIARRHTTLCNFTSKKSMC